MKLRINIILKPTILDPQGQAVASSLVGQGFENVKNVRQGKIFDIEFNSSKIDKKKINKMCEEFLSNPLIEDYSLEKLKE